MSNQPAATSTKPVAHLKVLVLGDSVAVRAGQARTGFARVLFNIFSRFPAGVPIDLWSIGFDGHGYKDLAVGHPNWTLIPADGRHQWNSVAGLMAFLKQLATGGYSHVFMLMDPDAISSNNFPAELKRVCAERKIQSLLYYPVDAPLQPPFDIIDAVQTAVTYTDYGRVQTRKAMGRSLFPVHVIPHGIDAHFTPVTPEERKRYRADFQVAVLDAKGKQTGNRPFLNGANDFLILNVNKNEWRKDPLRSLEILKGLRDRGIPAKMIFRMAPTSVMGGVHLERAGEQLGLTLEKEWAHIAAVPEEHMRGLYGAADLFMTTATGEGWGFGVTEALACGTPVAMPPHTSLYEIGERVLREHGTFPAVRFLEMEAGHVCGYDTRLRSRVDLEAAIEAIQDYREHSNIYPSFRVELPASIREWLSWDRIAGEFLKLMNLAVGQGGKS